MKQALEAGNHALDFQVGFVVFGNGGDPGQQIGVLAHPVIYTEAVEALDQEAHRAVFGFAHLQDDRGGAHGKKIIRAETRGFRFPAGQNPNDFILEHDLVHQGLGPFFPEGQGHNDAGKENHLRKGQYGQDPGADMLFRSFDHYLFIVSIAGSHQ